MSCVKRTWVDINLNNAAYNLRQIQGYTRAKVIAVVKADAYGHGAVQLSRMYSDMGVEHFAVACLDEAIELRDAGIKGEILILGKTPVSVLDKALDCDVIQTVFSIDYAMELSEKALSLGKKVKVHIKADTGMARLGFYVNDGEVESAADSIAKACKLEGLEVCGMFMHFADVENADCSFADKQFGLFSRLDSALKRRNIKIQFLHCANSAAVLNYKKAHLDFVRPGLILYGLYPDASLKGMLDIKPVMEFKSTVADVRTIHSGDSVSYGRTFVAERDMRVAVVCAGYADGLPRGLSNRAEFLICGKRARVLGRICMDMCMVDVTEIPQAKVGDTVTLFGKDGNDEISVDEWAEKLGTISYELCSIITKRVHRNYIKD